MSGPDCRYVDCGRDDCDYCGERAEEEQRAAASGTPLLVTETAAEVAAHYAEKYEREVADGTFWSRFDLREGD